MTPVFLIDCKPGRFESFIKPPGNRDIGPSGHVVHQLQSQLAVSRTEGGRHVEKFNLKSFDSKFRTSALRQSVRESVLMPGLDFNWLLSVLMPLVGQFIIIRKDFARSQYLKSKVQIQSDLNW